MKNYLLFIKLHKVIFIKLTIIIGHLELIIGFPLLILFLLTGDIFILKKTIYVI